MGIRRTGRKSIDVSRTFRVYPVGIEIRERLLVADLLQCLGRLMVDLEDTARSPPTRRLGLRHVLVIVVVVRASYAWLVRSHVVGDGSG